MAETLSTLKTRRSCRAYKSEAVEESKLNAIIEAGTYAASGMGVASCWVHRAKEEFESEEGKAILKKLGIEGDYEGIGNLILGYAEKTAVAPAPRKANYIYKI